jgi:hypothetical protein
MLNEEMYIKSLEEVSNEKFKTEEGTKENLKQLKKIFKKITKFAPKSFKMIYEFLFYKGSIPFENSPAKIITFLDQIGTTFSVYKLMGKDVTFNEFLSTNYGIKIIEIEEGFIDKTLNTHIEDDTVKELYQRYTLQNDNPKDTKDYLKGIFKEAINLQSQIEDTKQIVETKSNEIQETCKINKGNFIKSVMLKVKQMIKGKEEMNEEIKKIHEDYANFTDAIKPLN